MATDKFHGLNEENKMKSYFLPPKDVRLIWIFVKKMVKEGLMENRWTPDRNYTYLVLCFIICVGMNRVELGSIWKSEI